MGQIMGLFICKDCKYTGWLEDYELSGFIAEHQGHNIAMIDRDAMEEEDEFEKAIRHLMGWPVEEGE